MTNKRTKILATLLCATALAAGCSTPDPGSSLGGRPVYGVRTDTERKLTAVPPPQDRIDVAVYDFRDLTGQHKPNENFTEYSTAVTQGASAMLIKALEDAGRGRWFRISERVALTRLIQEREIIKTMREQYAGTRAERLPPLTFAAILLEGGVIAYESNVITGGLGARYLGIGGDTKYRRDSVTVYLRAVSTQTGEVLKTVSASKTIYSASVSASAFRFVSFKKLLEVETGVSINEPVQLAVRQAVEKAVLGLIAEGAVSGLWAFADRAAGDRLLKEYAEEQDVILTENDQIYSTRNKNSDPLQKVYND